MKDNSKKNDKENTFKFIFRSFNYRNYSLYFGGQTISMIGTWMQTVAMSWLVYRLTNSVYILGVVGFVSQIPNFLLSPFVGVSVDRWNRYRTLIVIQILAMLQAFVLSILVLTGKILIWHILLLGLILGIVNCFNATVRQSFVYNIIENKDDLGNAVSLNALINNMGRMLGPFIGGLMIVAVGEGICFLINGVTYLVVITALLAMNIKQQQIKKNPPNVIKELKEGFEYVFQSAPVRAIILLQGLVCLIGWPIRVLLPVFVTDILQGGPDTLGLLYGFSGAGAMLSTIFMASRKGVSSMIGLIPISAVIYGFGLVVFANSSNLWLCLSILLFTGFSMVVQTVASYTVVQTIIEDDKRGRVISIYNMAYLGMFPFGSLLIGSLADMIGVTNALLISGISCLAGSLLFISQYRAVRDSINEYLHTIVSSEKSA